jgi:hypothetical protein
MGGACGTHKREESGREKCTRFWWESQIPLGRPKRRWEDGIRMDLRQTGWGSGMDSVGSG